MNERWTWKPLEIASAGGGVAATAAGLVGYLRALPDVGELLVRHRALVFRGFNVTPATLPSVMDELLPNRLAYVHGNSPRTKVGRNVYTSTEYPSEFTISMHNELSYALRWPARLLFFCERPAESGGATPVVDGELWLRSLDPSLRSAFAGGLRYTQNLHGGYGLGRSWQDTFETGDRVEVEAFLRDAGAAWEWRSDGGLRISQTRPATIHHPVTGVEVWFNQVDQWHPAGLGDEAARELAQLLPAEDLPQSVSFADGGAIPYEYAVAVRDAGLAAAVDVDWAAGDLMLVDNVAVGHGRRPFTGARRVLVAMSG